MRVSLSQSLTSEEEALGLGLQLARRREQGTVRMTILGERLCRYGLVRDPLANYSEQCFFL